VKGDTERDTTEKGLNRLVKASRKGGAKKYECVWEINTENTIKR